jgi:asparagine synthase (glutamine-hydrolysing)
MAITAWIHHRDRDLRDERATLNALAQAITVAPHSAGATHLTRRAGFAHHGPGSGYADWRALERPEPDQVVLVDATLTHRSRTEEELYGQTRPLISDAELLLHAYRQWGEDLVNRLDGSFAVAIWDNQLRQLLLIRDPLGTKTLFFHAGADEAVISSRATALLAHPAVPAILDTDGLNDLLAMGPARTPGHGILRGVREVLPGQIVRITADGISERRYFRFEADIHGHSLEATARFLRGALADNTAAGLEHGSSGVLMSGGVASAAIAAFGAPLHQQPAAYTLLMPAGTVSPTDALEAARGARHLNLPHHLLIAGSSVLIEAGAAARRALDFPSEANDDVTHLAMLRCAAAAGVTTVLTGDGAQAVFGGYRWAIPATSAEATFPWLQRTLTPIDLLDPNLRRRLGTGDYRRHRYEQATANIDHLPGENPVARLQRRNAQLTLTHYLPWLLERLGQLAAAVGITAHTPYADWLLAQYLINVPWPTRHLRGIHNGLLRHAVADLLPSALVWRPSRPVPAQRLSAAWRHWQRHELRRIITDPNQPLHDLLDRQVVSAVLTDDRQHTANARADRDTTLAYLVELNAWLERHRAVLR